MARKGKRVAETEPPSFEHALEELESIVERLESGELGLDDSLIQFERGIELSRVCSDRLREAETRLEKLVRDEGGSLRAEEVTVFGGPDGGAENPPPTQDDATVSPPARKAPSRRSRRAAPAAADPPEDTSGTESAEVGDESEPGNRREASSRELPF
jgi:exodeoxyribonuclease VII small subunit